MNVYSPITVPYIHNLRYNLGSLHIFHKLVYASSTGSQAKASETSKIQILKTYAFPESGRTSTDIFILRKTDTWFTSILGLEILKCYFWVFL